MVASFKSRNDPPVPYKGWNLTAVRRYIVETQGKVVTIPQLKSFIDKLPAKKK